jgi:hypothetical protein
MYRANIIVALLAFSVMLCNSGSAHVFDEQDRACAAHETPAVTRYNMQGNLREAKRRYSPDCYNQPDRHPCGCGPLGCTGICRQGSCVPR